MSFPWLGITCGICVLLLFVPCSIFAIIPCPPQAAFALLGPPSLEPVFALQLSAFQLIQRVHCAPALRRDLASRLAAAGRASLPDGPLARAQQLMYHPVFQASFQAFLRGRLQAHSYQHELREVHRREVWKTLARERSQHFQGAFTRTLAWLNELTEHAEPDAPGSPVQAVVPQDQLLPVPRNGHIIKLLDAGGAFCQRCGKSTARVKRLKLKILKKACKFQHLPPEK